MKRRLCAVLTLSIVAALSVYAQDRIAVIDTVVPKGMDMGVVIPVTEKIMEEFVRSKLFIVLDRAFISKTLSEQEFSISDLTSGDSKTLATIGGFLQSNYIVVSTVQQLDKTFFLSAKMIEVKSGVIMAQTSVDRTGSIAVLIDMAAELGRKLVTAATGQEVPATATVKPTQSVAPTQTTEDTKPAASTKVVEEAKPKPARFSSIAAEFGVTTTVATTTENQFDIYYLEEGSYTQNPGVAYGISAIFPTGLLYLSTGGLVVDTLYEDSILDYSITTQSLSLFAGLGVDIPIGPVLLYAGIKGGLLVFTESTYNLVDDFEATWLGGSFGIEFGGDLRLGILDIGLRYVFDSGTVSDLDSYWQDLELEIGALSLRAGIAF